MKTLHQKIVILPREQEIMYFCQINNTGSSEYSISKKYLEVKLEEKMYFEVKVFNQTKFKFEDINYPNTWVQIDLIDDKLNTLQSEFMKMKEKCIIIKKNKINFKKFNFRLILKKQDKMLDTAIVYVV
jgi:hypothetical protein